MVTHLTFWQSCDIYRSKGQKNWNWVLWEGTDSKIRVQWCLHYCGSICCLFHLPMLWASVGLFSFHFKPVVNFQVRGPHGVRPRGGEGWGRVGRACRPQPLFIRSAGARQWREGSAPGTSLNQSPHLGHRAAPWGCLTQSAAFLWHPKQAERPEFTESRAFTTWLF